MKHRLRSTCIEDVDAVSSIPGIPMQNSVCGPLNGADNSARADSTVSVMHADDPGTGRVPDSSHGTTSAAAAVSIETYYYKPDGLYYQAYTNNNIRGNNMAPSASADRLAKNAQHELASAAGASEFAGGADGFDANRGPLPAWRINQATVAPTTAGGRPQQKNGTGLYSQGEALSPRQQQRCDQQERGDFTTPQNSPESDETRQNHHVITEQPAPADSTPRMPLAELHTSEPAPVQYPELQGDSGDDGASEARGTSTTPSNAKNPTRVSEPRRQPEATAMSAGIYMGFYLLTVLLSFANGFRIHVPGPCTVPHIRFIHGAPSCKIRVMRFLPRECILNQRKLFMNVETSRIS